MSDGICQSLSVKEKTELFEKNLYWKTEGDKDIMKIQKIL